MRPIIKRSIIICIFLLTAGITFFSFVAEKNSKAQMACTIEEKARLLLKLKDLKDQKGRLNNEIEELKKHAGIRDQELKELQKTLEEKEKELEKKIPWWVRVDRAWLKGTIDKEKQLSEKLSKELSDERNNACSLKEEFHKVKEDFTEKEESIQKLAAACKDLEAKNAVLNETLQAREDQNKLLNVVLLEEKDKLKKLNEEKGELLAQAKTFRKENEGLKNSLLQSTQKESDLYERILALEDMSKKLSSAKELLQSKHDALLKEKAKLEEKIVKITEEKTLIEKEVEKAVVESPGLHNKIEKLKAELDMTNKAREALEQQYKEVLIKNQTLMERASVDGSLEVASVKNFKPKVIKERKNKTLMSGKIQASNNIHNFYIINLGTRDGVSVGDIYCVLRGNRRIAEIEVSNVRDKSSFASAFSIEDGEKIIVGDDVR